MLVSATWNTHKGAWDIFAKEGKWEDFYICSCEAISLKHCTFHYGTIFGHPVAVYGASLNYEIALDPKTIHGLGINRVFDFRSRNPARFLDGRFVDANTEAALKSVSSAVLFKLGVYYRA